MELSEFVTPFSAIGVLDALATSSDISVTPFLEDRLSKIGRDLPWLSSLSKNYFEVTKINSEIILDRGLELVDLISWICSPLRGNNSWVLLNEKTLTRSSEAASELSLSRPMHLKLFCWVASIPTDGIEKNFPVLLNTRHLDPNLDLAFSNLVKHISTHNWETDSGEIDATSMSVRISGIVNFINSDHDLRKAFSALILKLKGTMPLADENLFKGTAWVNDLVDTRNVVAHVVSSREGLTLKDAWDRSQDIDQIRKILRLSSYFVANEIREKLLGTDAGYVKVWGDRVDEELMWYLGN
jgi:hypothetical protein